MGGVFDDFKNAMPSVLRSALGGVERDPASAVNALPADNAMKGVLLSKLKEIEDDRAAQVTFKETAVKAERNIHSYNKYMRLLDTLPELSADQLVEKIWVKAQLDRSPTDFEEYVKSKLTNTTRENTLRLLAASNLAQQLLAAEQSVLTQVQANQEYMGATLGKWESYLDTQIKEKDALYRKLSGLHATQQRESLFNVTDIKTLSKWKKRIEIAFAVVLLLLVLVLCTKYYSAEIRRMGQKYMPALPATAAAASK
jgi:hypothetical protein